MMLMKSRQHGHVYDVEFVMDIREASYYDPLDVVVSTFNEITICPHVRLIDTPPSASKAAPVVKLDKSEAR